MVEYTKSQLTNSASPTPKAHLVPAGAEAIAFDSSGNLWLATGMAASVVEYARSQLTAASPTKAVTLSGIFGEPHGVTFDSSGGLWVADYTLETVLEFTKAKPRGGSFLDAPQDNRRGEHPAPRTCVPGLGAVSPGGAQEQPLEQ